MVKNCPADWTLFKKLETCFGLINLVTAMYRNDNKTGLQPVSRPVELVLYFGGWVEGPNRQTGLMVGVAKYL